MHLLDEVHPQLCVATHSSGTVSRGTTHLLHVVQPQLGRVAIPLVSGHYPLELQQALHEGHRCRALLTHCPIQQRDHIPAEHTSPGICPGHGSSQHPASCQQGEQLMLVRSGPSSCQQNKQI